MDLGENKNWAEQTALSFDAVEKAYGEFCLGPLTLKLPAGCVTGLVGENGAGKTTGAGDGYSRQRNRIVPGFRSGQRRKTGEEGCGSCLWRTSDSRKFYGSDGGRFLAGDL